MRLLLVAIYLSASTSLIGSTQYFESVKSMQILGAEFKYMSLSHYLQHSAIYLKLIKASDLIITGHMLSFGFRATNSLYQGATSCSLTHHIGFPYSGTDEIL